MAEPAPDLLTHLKQLEAADPGSLPYRTALIQVLERLAVLESAATELTEVIERFRPLDLWPTNVEQAELIHDAQDKLLAALKKETSSAK